MREGLIERGVELERLGRLVEEVAAGDGRIVVLEGPAGIGKTTLVRALVERARAEGFGVVSARGGELERELAFGAVRQLFERAVARGDHALAGAAAPAAAAFGVAAGGSGPAVRQNPGEQELSIVHGLYWLAADLAEERPLLVVLDDAQWADRPSLRFTAYLARRLEGLPILLAMTVRTGERPFDEALLAAVAAEPEALSLRLRPLSEAGVESLVRSRFGDEADPEFCRACHAAAGGNPFFSRELIAALLEDGIPPVAASASRVLDIGPEAIARSLLLRLARMPGSCRALARAIAVLGAEAEIRHAARLAEVGAEEAALAADALAAAGLLRPGRPLAFAHPVLRSVVYGDIPDGERANAHRAAARMLHAERAPLREAALHLLAADPIGEPWAVGLLREAARAEVTPEQAVTFLRRALDEPPGAVERPEVLVELGEAEAAAFEPPELVAEHLGAAVQLAVETPLRARAALGLAGALNADGRPGEALDRISRSIAELEALDLAPASPERELLLRSEALRLSARALIGESLTPHRFSELRRLAGSGATPGERVLLANLAYDAPFAGVTAEEAAHLALRALADGRLIEDRFYFDHYVAIWALEFADRLAEAEAAATLAIERARERASLGEYAFAQTVRALIGNRCGALRQAEADARAALELAEDALDPGALRLARIVLADALGAQGRPADGRQALASLDAPEHPSPVNAFGLYVRGRLADGPEEAREAFLQAGRMMRQVGTDHPAYYPWRSSAALSGAPRSLVEQELEVARSWGAPRTIGVALRAAGLLDSDLDALRESVAVLETSPATGELAISLVELGAALRRRKDRAASREPLLRGLDLAHRCGAVPLEQRAREELAATGARPRRAVLTGLESLTASELRVARLAAQGLSNRDIAQTLFISLPTVEKHLGQTYRKLDLASRRDLPEALAR